MGVRVVKTNGRKLEIGVLENGKKRGLSWDGSRWYAPDPVPKPLGAWLRRVGWEVGEAVEGKPGAIEQAKPIVKVYRKEDREVLRGGPACDGPGVAHQAPVDDPSLAGVPWTGEEPRIGGFRVLPRRWVQEQLRAALGRIQAKARLGGADWQELLLMRYVVEQAQPAEQRRIAWSSAVMALDGLRAMGREVPTWWREWLLEQAANADLVDARLREEGGA